MKSHSLGVEVTSTHCIPVIQAGLRSPALLSVDEVTTDKVLHLSQFPFIPIINGDNSTYLVQKEVRYDKCIT